MKSEDTLVTPLTPTPEDDILEVPGISNSEEEEMLAKYHHENAIYLYCVVDRQVATTIITKNNCTLPIKLYETQAVAHRAVANTNIQNKVTLRFPVTIQANKLYYYDEFTMTDDMIKDKTGKAKAEFIEHCSYTRTFNKSLHCIEYLIKDNSILSSPQIV